MTTKKWELKDIIMMAILGVVFSAIYLAVFDGGVVLSTVLAPTGLSNFAFEIIYGVWFMAATLAAYIIRKPGVALVAEVQVQSLHSLYSVIRNGIWRACPWQAYFPLPSFSVMSFTI